MNSFTVRIAAIHEEAEDIRSFELKDEHGRLLPEFSPGAHVTVHLPCGQRQYSIYSSSNQLDCYRIAVKLEPQSRGGSLHMWEGVRCGDTLQISGPTNAFPLDGSATRSMFLAGGIGITPIVCMLNSLLGQEGHSVELDYFVRSSAHMPFRGFLEQPSLQGRVRLFEGLDPSETRNQLDARLVDYVAGTHLYICGPGAFVEAARVATANWPQGTVHVEAFGAAPAGVSLGAAFEVELRRSGLRVNVPEHMSLLEALQQHDVPIEASCEQGICGTCMTKVLEGTPEHNDLFLSDDEKSAGDCMMPCVSRAAGGRLVLDL